MVNHIGFNTKIASQELDDFWATQRGSLDLHHPRPARCPVEFFWGQTLGVNGKW